MTDSGDRGARGLLGMPEPSIFARSRPGRRGVTPPPAAAQVGAPSALLPGVRLRAAAPALPEVSEPEVVRHFTRVSQFNYAVDTGFYPLGSCTMKHNPRINEEMAALPGFAHLHPGVPQEAAQGALRLMWELERDLAQIAGMDRVTLQPAAGAQGELCGMLIVRAYHVSRGQRRTKVIVPDSAHGTNPATAAMAGFEVVEVPSDERGSVDVEALAEVLDDQVAALMLTNPNTLGLFEENIERIAELVHAAGGLLYYDGANANAIMGLSRPGDMGFDIVHFNLHKTFSTPHGMGGPGAGPVGVKAELVPYLPLPTVERSGAGDSERFRFDYDRPQSIGRLRSAYGNFGVLVRAHTYIRSLGGAGLKQVSEDAVLNANYLLHLLRRDFDLPFDRICKHEFVVSAANIKKETGVRALDIAKRLLDYGYHPPTVYFPLVVEEAMMVEPTETETKETLDDFAAALHSIVAEAREDPDRLHEAPTRTVVRRLDEATAARRPRVRYERGSAPPTE